MNPADRYVGWAYDPATADCADLVIQVQRELFGREVDLPNGKPRGNRGRAVMQRTALAQCAPTETPVDGDLVLMREAGKSRPGHAGVYFQVNGEGWVLHATEKIGCAVFHRVRDLPMWGCFIEGCYSWK